MEKREEDGRRGRIWGGVEGGMEDSGCGLIVWVRGIGRLVASQSERDGDEVSV